MEFSKIGEVAVAEIQHNDEYLYYDKSADHVNYYRLKILDKDGKFTYSKVVKMNQSRNREITVFPTLLPAKL
jgi:hypothetical protein